MLLTIDAGPGTVYDRIADAIVVRIASGEIAQGERLPAARDLADALGINAHTVLHAYQRLQDDGVVELRRGRGAVVTGATAGTELREAISATAAAAKRQGLGAAALLALVRKEYGA